MKFSYPVAVFALMLPVTTFFPVGVSAQNGLPATPPANDPATAAANAAFANNIKLALNFEKSNPSVALAYYQRAFDSAQTDSEKAQAKLGIGNNTPLWPRDDDAKNENAARLAAFRAVTELPGATEVQKFDATLGMAQTRFQIEQYDLALGGYTTVLNGANSTAEQKATARQGSGDTLLAMKRYDDARNMLAVITGDATSSTARKRAARQTIARSYLRQDNPRAAQAEMKKIVTPDLKDEAAAQIYLEIGQFFRNEKQYALARAAYETIPALAEASVDANIVALLQIGSTYFEEKDYIKARETWNSISAMRGSEKFAGMVWRSIGVAYGQEKNYSAARDAFGKWREAAVADVRGQVESWEATASTFLDEKNFEGAREALGNVQKIGAKLPNVVDQAQLNLRAKLGVAQTYRVEGNFAQAAVVYSEVLDLVPISRSDPSHYYEARNQFKAAADEMAKEKNSMSAAYTLYEKWEKFYPYEFNKAEANMAMGDILAAQGKKEEAKAKYQRVMELRKNYDEFKIAQSKIAKLDGNGGA